MTNLNKFQGVETTTVRHSDGELAGYYRGTDVARVNGSLVKLNTGGWMSRTTKVRMNQFSRNFCDGVFTVYQRNYNWFVDVNGQTLKFDGNRLEFTI